MPLPSSGVIKFSDINVELGVAANTSRKLSDSAVRTLFGVASGRITLSNGFGKSNRVSVTVTVAANTTNYTLGTAQIPGYVAGKTDVTFVVNSGVYVYSTNTANAGLTVAALNVADTVSIVNNGFIMGMGGRAGGDASGGATVVSPEAGGPAISISRSVNITNNSSIAGGGGGGARGSGSAYSGDGGGGAGGGPSGAFAVGGGPGQPGVAVNSAYSGGRILPGSLANQAGGAGGASEDASFEMPTNGGAGGLTNQPGQTMTTLEYNAVGGAGGGGWGAAGGARGVNLGGAGGKAVNLNGNTVTWVVTGTRYGVIS